MQQERPSTGITKSEVQMGWSSVLYLSGHKRNTTNEKEAQSTAELTNCNSSQSNLSKILLQLNYQHSMFLAGSRERIFSKQLIYMRSSLSTWSEGENA